MRYFFKIIRSYMDRGKNCLRTGPLRREDGPQKVTAFSGISGCAITVKRHASRKGRRGGNPDRIYGGKGDESFLSFTRRIARRHDLRLPIGPATGGRASLAMAGRPV